MHVKGKDSWIKHLDFIVIDIIIYLFSFVAANLFYLKDLHYYPNELYYSVFICIIFPCLFIDIIYSPFSGVLRRNSSSEILIAVKYTAYEMVFSVLLMYIEKIGGLFSRFTFVLTYVLYAVLIIIARILWKKILISGKIPYFSSSNITLLIVGEKNRIGQILQNINQEEYKQYDIKGVCVLGDSTVGDSIEDIPVLCGQDGLYESVIGNNIMEVFYACEPSVIDKDQLSKLISEGVGIHLSVDDILGVTTDESILDKVGIYKTLGFGLYTFTAGQRLYFIVKRFFDILISLVMMIPLLLFSLIVKVIYVGSGDSAPVFFHQTRIGKNGVPFELYKFRTMIPDAEKALEEILLDEKKKKEWNEYHKFEEDPRITKVGRFLRISSLDELPQFVNVLKGDMSFIGPRPLVEGELKQHNGLKLYERLRPGITGWWACNGRSNISYEERLDMEYFYVKNCSFILDLFTLLRTIYVVITKTGAK